MYTVTNISSSPSFLHPHYSLLRTTPASFSLYVNTRCLTRRETSISSISSPSHQRLQYSSEFAPSLAHTIFQTYSQMSTDSLLPCSHRSFLHKIAYAIRVLRRHSLQNSSSCESALSAPPTSFCAALAKMARVTCLLCCAADQFGSQSSWVGSPRAVAIIHPTGTSSCRITNSSSS